MKYWQKWCILSVVIFAATGMAQTMTNAVDSLFYRGVTAYETGNFRNALELFELLDGLYPRHVKTTASLLMQGKCHYKLRQYEQSRILYSNIIENHPNSSYSDDALYGLGNVLYRQGNKQGAVTGLLEVVENGKDSRLQAKAARLARDIMEKEMGSSALEKLLGRVTGMKGTAAVTLILAEKEAASKHFHRARSVLNAFLETYPSSPYQGRIQGMLEKMAETARGSLKIGVILPLSGPLAEEGKGLFDGIRYAVDDYNKNSNATVDLVFEDSGSNIVKAIHAAQRLAGNEEIVAIIGEVESDITAGIAAVAQQARIPLLSPLATAEGLASIGDFIFQCNASIRERAEALGEYAVNTAGLKRFAILAPADPYGADMVEQFKAAVQTRDDVEILMEKWYYTGEGAKSLQAQFVGIREAGIQRMLEDSVLIIVPEDEYQDALLRPGSAIYVKQSFEELVDSTNLALTSIDGVFIPAWAEDLPYIIPQLARYNIGAQVLGGSQWYKPEMLEEHKTWVEGTIFLCDYYVDPSDYTFHQFRDQFRVVMNRSPEKNEIFGYDTAGLLLSVCRGQFVDRGTVQKLLAGVSSYKGIRGPYNLTKNRVNPFVRLLRYRAGNFLIVR